jgi:hypothetical protein
MPFEQRDKELGAIGASIGAPLADRCRTPWRQLTPYAGRRAGYSPPRIDELLGRVLPERMWRFDLSCVP